MYKVIIEIMPSLYEDYKSVFDEIKSIALQTMTYDGNGTGSNGYEQTVIRHIFSSTSDDTSMFDDILTNYPNLNITAVEVQNVD